MTSPLQQKPRVKGPVVVTANRLADGAVVYRTAGEGWTEHLDEAAVTTDAEVATQLLAAAKADHLRAVDVYVAAVEIAADGRINPANLRERIRQAGPTVSPPGHAAHRAIA